MPKGGPGGGSFSIHIFDHEIDKNSHLTVQDMFFFNNYIEKNQNKTHFEEGTSEIAFSFRPFQA